MAKRGKKSKKSKKIMTKVLVGLGVVGAAVIGYVLYKRSAQPGKSDVAGMR